MLHSSSQNVSSFNRLKRNIDHPETANALQGSASPAANPILKSASNQSTSGAAMQPYGGYKANGYGMSIRALCDIGLCAPS